VLECEVRGTTGLVRSGWFDDDPLHPSCCKWCRGLPGERKHSRAPAARTCARMQEERSRLEAQLARMGEEIAALRQADKGAQAVERLERELASVRGEQARLGEAVAALRQAKVRVGEGPLRECKGWDGPLGTPFALDQTDFA
jgi:hypothetical protein